MANLNLNQFKGLDTLHSPAAIADEAQSVLVNYTVNERGYLQKRTGLHRSVFDDADGLHILGRFKTAAFDRMIVTNPVDDDLDYTFIPLDAFSTLTQISASISAGVTHGAQYSDDFYIASFAGDSYAYDGTTLTTFTSKVNGTQNFFHLDREWIVNAVSGSLQDSLRYSEIAGSGGTDFSTANHPAANVILVGVGDGFACTKLIKFNDNLFVFKQASTWTLFTENNTPADWTLRQIEPTIGCTSHLGAVIHENLLYFLSLEGVYRTDGTTFEEISAPIRDFWQNRELPTNLYDLNFLESVAILGEYLFIFVHDESGASGFQQKTFVYNIRTKGWSEFIWANRTAGEQRMRTPLVVPDFGPPLMYLGELNGVEGRIYWFGQNDTWTDESDDPAFSNNTPYESYFETKFYDFGEPGTWKRMTDATIDYFILEDPLKWTWLYEDHSSSTEWTIQAVTKVGATIENARALDQLTPANWFRSVKGKLTDDSSDQDHVIYGLTFNATERRIVGKQLTNG